MNPGNVFRKPGISLFDLLSFKKYKFDLHGTRLLLHMIRDSLGSAILRTCSDKHANNT